MSDALVLSLSPMTKGFGFVLFEAPLAPFDWGVREVRGALKNRRILKFVESMIDRYAPLVLVLEDWTDDACKKSARVIRLYASLAELARKKCVQLVRVSKGSIRRCFASVVPTTKYEIALSIGKAIPALSYQIPPVRKIWMSEDPRQSLYDAAALGLTYFATEHRSSEVRTKKPPTIELD